MTWGARKNLEANESTNSQTIDTIPNVNMNGVISRVSPLNSLN